jgi:hypothetical protein
MRSGVPEDQGALFGLQYANPGAGNPIDIVALAGQRWSIDAIGLIFTTSAAVANRQVYITFYDGVLPVAGTLIHPTIQVAGQTRTYTFSRLFAAVPYDAAGWFMFPLRGPVIIDSVSGIRITANNIDAADTFTDIKIRGHRWIDG